MTRKRFPDWSRHSARSRRMRADPNAEQRPAFERKRTVAITERLRTLPATLLVFALLAAALPPAPSDTALHAALQRDISQYLSTRGKIERLSAISLSVSMRGRYQNINLTAGRTQWGTAGLPVSPANLRQ